MSGSIHYRKTVNGGWYYILWYSKEHGRGITISRNKYGDRMETEAQARKLLAQMQARVDEGKFKLEEFTGPSWSEVCEYLDVWFNSRKESLAPGTQVGYEKSIRLYLKPYFTQHRLHLHEIKYDVLTDLINGIKTVANRKVALTVLKSCLRHAWRSERIQYVPPFPEVRLPDRVPTYLSEEDQWKIFDAIPQEHRPIYLWCYYHLRRPNEAQALMWEDWDAQSRVFTIRHGVSREIIGPTKTGKVHLLPIVRAFGVYWESVRKGFSPFIFNHQSNATEGNRYTLSVLEKIWNKACAEVGIEGVTLYQGTKQSRAGQLMNEYGLSESELQMAGDWKDVRSVRSYARANVATRRRLLEGNVVRMERKVEDAGNKV